MAEGEFERSVGRPTRQDIRAAANDLLSPMRFVLAGPKTPENRYAKWAWQEGHICS